MTDTLFTAPGEYADNRIKGSISKPDLSTTGKKTVTIEYMGQTTEFFVYVIGSKMQTQGYRD